MNKKDMTVPSIGIIGIGNPLRKDDGIGLTLLEYMKNHADHYPSNVFFVDGGTGGMNLLHLFNRYNVIILLDAVDFRGKPGDTRFFSFDDICSQKQISTVSTHNTDVFQIIRLGQTLDECPNKIFVFGVQPEDVSYGEGLSKSIQLQIESIFSQIENFVSEVIKNQ
jgi:hydrogenase maturation protease